MSEHHPIRCTCGAVTGSLTHVPWAHRVVCYCQSCQAFAERLGRADDVLDAQGGSDIVQTSPRCLTFATGREHLACLRITPKGPLRWYAACCNSPIGNTSANPRLAFVGLLRCLGDRATLDAAFGPPRTYVFTRSARGERKPKQHLSIPGLGAFMWHVAVARVTGSYRETPFFDESGAPVAVPGDGPVLERT